MTMQSLHKGQQLGSEEAQIHVVRVAKKVPDLFPTIVAKDGLCQPCIGDGRAALWGSVPME